MKMEFASTGKGLASSALPQGALNIRTSGVRLHLRYNPLRAHDLHPLQQASLALGIILGQHQWTSTRVNNQADQAPIDFLGCASALARSQAHIDRRGRVKREQRLLIDL